MKICYVEQSVQNLRFGVYQRTLDRVDFRIFRSQVFEQANYRGELWVIGGSHVLNLHTEHAALAEVLTCATRPLPTEAQLGLLEDVGNNDCEYHLPGGIGYKASLVTHHYSQEAFQHAQAQWTAQTPPHRLAYRFPQREGLGAAPMTGIDLVRIEQALLEVRTFHSYPGNCAIVWTHSVIQLG